MRLLDFKKKYLFNYMKVQKILKTTIFVYFSSIFVMPCRRFQQLRILTVIILALKFYVETENAKLKSNQIIPSININICIINIVYQIQYIKYNINILIITDYLFAYNNNKVFKQYIKQQEIAHTNSLQNKMSSNILMVGAIGAITTGIYFIHSKFLTTHKSQQLLCLSSSSEEEDNNKTVQDIIKDVYIRVNTKQNMKVISQLYNMEGNSINISKQQILKPYQYTLRTGGKKIRLIMAVIVAQMFISKPKTKTISNSSDNNINQINEQDRIMKQILQVGGLIQLLHSASLIIDDIEDGSIQRRGEQCSHLVFGMDRSINAANLMYFLPFNKLLNSISETNKKVQILKIFIQQMTVSHMGQAQDVIVHKVKSKQQLPTLEQYETLTIAKTSSLLRMMVKMLCVLLNRSKQQMEQLCQVMNYVGLAFQVTDDVLNLTRNLGKGGIAEDLKEKKFTPIINCLRDNQKFISYFVLENKDEQTIKSMLDIIVQSDALQQTKKLAQKYQQIAEKLIKNMKTPYSKKKFEKLMKFIITREN